MPSVWKTIHVFISSTFRDMHTERDHLIKVVFPTLRERLEKYRIYLDDIDLRWGVTREQAENDQVLKLCLEEIGRCQPFFLGILGERYGWSPARLPDDALRSFAWIEQFSGRSVTELEILHGVLNSPTMCGRTFFYFRDPEPLSTMPENIRTSTFAETEPDRIARLADLKQRIRKSGRPLMDPYPARWDSQTQRLTGLEAFGDRVREELWAAIKAEHNLPDSPPPEETLDPLAVELDYHERFMESRLRVHVRRQQINDALLAFAESDATIPCLVTGSSGSGKSASLARFVLDFLRTHPDALVVPHFIGASPRSTNLREMLRRFCQVLNARLSLADEVPEEVTKLAVAFREFIDKVPPTMRVLFVIDAVNQLDETDRAQHLAWLPAHFSPQVKVVMSCISDSGKAEPALEAIARRQHVPLKVGPLQDNERRQIIQEVPSLSAKALDEQQIEQLLANPATTNPLYLLVALEELRGFGSYELLNQRIAAFPREGDTVTAIFTQVIERLEEEFAREVVRPILLLLAVARRGLAERELQELVAGLPGADDLFPILRQLRPYLLRRANLVDFYHRNLYKAVRDRYLDTPEKLRAGHARLAVYFNEQDYWQETLEQQRERAKRLPPTPRPANSRKVDELLWQLLRAEQWERCEQFLTDLQFLEAKVEGGMVFDLVEDYVAFLDTVSFQLPYQQILQLLEESLRSDIHFIRCSPTAMFQCLWNRCWWYDCPEAEKHYEISDAHRGTTHLPWAHSEPKLSTLLERWRAEKERATPGFVWLRSLRPPVVHLGTGMRQCFRGHHGNVNSVIFSAGGDCLVSGSNDCAVRVWDAVSGAELLCLKEHQHWVTSVDYSPTTHRIVSGSGDKTVRVWDAASGSELLCFRAHQRHVRTVRFSRDGRWIASGSDDGTVRIWDANQGTELMQLETEGRRPVTCVCFSPDGNRIAFGSMYGWGFRRTTDAKRFGRFQTIRVWDLSTGEELWQVNQHQEGHSTITLHCINYSPNGDKIVSGSGDGTMWIWDAEYGVEILALRGHKDTVYSVQFSPDGTSIASGAGDHTVRVWDAVTGMELYCLQGHQAAVKSVGYSPNARRIVSGSSDGMMLTWDATRGSEPLSLKGKSVGIECVYFYPGESRIVSGGGSALTLSEIRFWDAATGEALYCLNGPQGSVRSIGFSADGSRMASGLTGLFIQVWILEDQPKLLWNAKHGEKRPIPENDMIGKFLNSDLLKNFVRENRSENDRYLQDQFSYVHGVSFCSDGTELVSGAEDGTVRVWDAASGSELMCLRGHDGWVSAVAFSPDGSRIVSGAVDKTVRVWDRMKGTEVLCLRGHDSDVKSVGYSLDGLRIVSGESSASGSIQVLVWDAINGQCLSIHERVGSIRPFLQSGGIPNKATGHPFGMVLLSQEMLPCVWWPNKLNDFQCDSSGRLWIGHEFGYLGILQLEGNLSGS